jgi:hypothetical protein
MSNTQGPQGGNVPSEEPDEGDDWSGSLLRRTEEFSHVQMQAGPAPEPRATPPDAAYPGIQARSSPEQQGPGPTSAAPARGAPTRGAPARGAPAPPPPRPVRPLASALWLGSAACALVSAVLLVLPELQHAWADSASDALPETTLAPSFDTTAPLRDGEVREQQAAIAGASVLMIDSEPSGVTVSVDGVKQGTTPLSLTPMCNPGALLRVKFVRKGFESLEHTLVCREDMMTQLTGRLRKSRGSAKP